MTNVDVSMPTVGNLFFDQVRNLTLATTKKSAAYKKELGTILETYAPDSSKMYREKFKIYR